MTNNSIKAEYKMESVRLVQVKDRPFFSVVGVKSVAFVQSLVRSS